MGFFDVGRKAQSGHAFAKAPVQARIALAALFDAPFFAQFLHRAVEGGDHVRGRREAPLAVAFFKALPLVVEVERHRSRIPLGRFERFAARDDVGEARNALDALVGARDEIVDADVGDADVDGPEGAHGVDDEGAARGLHDAAHGFNVVQNPRRRFVVNHRNDRHFGMFGEEGLDPGGVGDFVPGEVKTVVRDAVTVENLHHAFGISAVHENEDAVLCARNAREDGLDAEGARALHENDRVAVARVREVEKTRADLFGHALVVVVPRAAVDHHRFAHGQGRRQRPRGKELVRIRIAHDHSPFTSFWCFCRSSTVSGSEKVLGLAGLFSAETVSPL